MPVITSDWGRRGLRDPLYVGFTLDRKLQGLRGPLDVDFHFGLGTIGDHARCLDDDFKFGRRTTGDHEVQ